MVAIPIVLFVLTFTIPIKFTLKSLASEEEDFYIIQFFDVWNSWLIIGDKTGLYDDGKDYFVNINGEKNPKKIVSCDIYYYGNTSFIVWGEKTLDPINNQLHHIECTRWEVLSKVESRNSFRNMFSKKYLNIWDYKWFDDFREWLGYFDDYEVP